MNSQRLNNPSFLKIKVLSFSPNILVHCNVQYYRSNSMGMQMKNKCDYWLILCFALASVTVPGEVVFARDCPCLRGKCDISAKSNDHPAQCCCELPATEVDHKSKDHSDSEGKKPAGKCPCCVSQIVNSPTAIQCSSIQWITNRAVRACQYRSRTCYTSHWVLKILRPPSC
jgi:hypothetical protein